MSSNVATSPEFERFRATFFEECAEILPELDERLSSLHVGEVDFRNPERDFQGGSFDQGRRRCFQFQSAGRVCAYIRSSARQAAR